jgi:hypothetical protein
MTEPTYLRDGVSIEMEGDRIKLTAGANVIFLEPEAFAALERFVKSDDAT